MLEKKHKIAIGAVVVLAILAIYIRATHAGKTLKSKFCGAAWDPAAVAEANALAVVGAESRN